MNLHFTISEEEIAGELWEQGLLDVLGLLALDKTDAQVRRMVDYQYSGSTMHDQIPVLLRQIADEIESTEP